MHWTLIALLALSGLAAVLNAVQLAATGTVRTAGILICAAWAVQQGYWWATGSDSFVLFAVCDGLIIAWFLSRRRAFDLAERLIAAAIPVTTALGVFAWFNEGHTAVSWWTNWWLVAGQMTLGLPVPRAQTIATLVSHGKLRPEARHGGA